MVNHDSLSALINLSNDMEILNALNDDSFLYDLTLLLLVNLSLSLFSNEAKTD